MMMTQMMMIKDDDVYACSCEYFSKPQLARVNAVHLAPL
jgi:hypothetical protein